MTREEWLTKACAELDKWVAQATGIEVPKYYISVGFAKGNSGRQKVIGQCWNGKLSKDGKPHIFICPTLQDPITVLATVVHEIIHTVYPNDGHKAMFATAAGKCGLLKPWTATTPGPTLLTGLTRLAEHLGEYPHAALSVPARGSKGSRMKKHVCNSCGTIVYKAAEVFHAICTDRVIEEDESTECRGVFVRDA